MESDLESDVQSAHSTENSEETQVVNDTIHKLHDSNIKIKQLEESELVIFSNQGGILVVSYCFEIKCFIPFGCRILRSKWKC